MAAPPSQLAARRAHDRVAQDAGLAEELATELARALQLPGTNRTLGRTFVRYGLAALKEPTEERAEQAFLAKAKSLASIRPELASQLRHRVRGRLRNATLQLAAERDEAAAAARGGAGVPILGFSRATASIARYKGVKSPSRLSVWAASLSLSKSGVATCASAPSFCSVARCAAACTKRASPKSHKWNWTISGAAPSARRDAALIARALAIDASCVTYLVYTTGARPRSRSMPISVSDRP